MQETSRCFPQTTTARSGSQWWSRWIPHLRLAGIREETHNAMTSIGQESGDLQESISVILSLLKVESRHKSFINAYIFQEYTIPNMAFLYWTGK